MKFEIRDVDALNTPDGWEWNASYRMGDFETKGNEKTSVSPGVA